MLVAARPTFVYVVRCVVSTVLNTALRPLDLWFGWLVHFKVTLSEIAKQNVLGDSMCISINRFPAKTHHFYLSNDKQDDLITSPNTLT